MSFCLVVAILFVISIHSSIVATSLEELQREACRSVDLVLCPYSMVIRFSAS